MLPVAGWSSFGKRGILELKLGLTFKETYWISLLLSTLFLS
jgi:hypothetical protein